MKASGIFASALFAMVATAPLHASSFAITFDENGNATYVDSGSPTQNGYGATTVACGSNFCGTATSGLETDPLGGTGGQVLVYDLPELVLSGPVGVLEPGGGSVSDVLWFTNSDGVSNGQLNANFMIFYSGDLGGGALADSGLPTTLIYSGQGAISDIATENADGTFQWLPDSGNLFPAGNEYDGLSNSAPEPATSSMFLLAAGVIGFGAWRRRVRA